ncbi:MAG: hypothetical protein B7733_19705 [Myxococcales bacterium FL481]|nr:MAG: hypothetical protein B7733_19705 [Myxococcales bacterium FL481]
MSDSPSTSPLLPRAFVAFGNKLLVTVYKLLGFAVLALLLAGLVGYLAIFGIYFIHDAWVVPAVISPTDSRVLDLRTRLAHEHSLREKLAADRVELVDLSRRATATSELQRGFAKDIEQAIDRDAKTQQAHAASLDRRRRRQAAAARNITRDLAGHSAHAKKRLDEALEANMISHDEYVRGGLQLVQMQRMELALAQEAADLEGEVESATARAQALQSLANAAARDRSGSGASYEVSRLYREMQQARAAAGRAADEANMHGKRIEALDRAIAQYDEVIETIQSAPILRAAEERVYVGFVPYDNLHEFTPGRELYACTVAALVGCRAIGTVGAILDGEVSVRHPVYNRDVRGQMVALDLDSERWVREPVLHVGRAPLLL